VGAKAILEGALALKKGHTLKKKKVGEINLPVKRMGRNSEKVKKGPKRKNRGCRYCLKYTTTGRDGGSKKGTFLGGRFKRSVGVYHPLNENTVPR